MNPPSRDEDFDWEAQVGARRFSLRPRNARWAIVAGYVVSQIVGWGAFVLAVAIFWQFNWLKMGSVAFVTAGILGYSQLFLIPFGMGVVAAYFWLDENAPAGNLNEGRLGGSSFLNTLLACIIASFFLGAGSIGLVPFWAIPWFLMWLGVGMGTRFWRKNPFFRV